MGFPVAGRRTRALASIAVTLALLSPVASRADVADPREKAWSLSTVLELARERGEQVPTQWATPPSVYLGAGGPADNPDVRVTLSNTTQSENSIAVHPLDNSILFQSNNSTNFPVSQLFGTSVFWSTDGGATWAGTPNGPGATNSGDPAAAIDRNGKFYVGYIAGSGGMGVAFSTNMGTSWTNVSVYSPGGQDKNHLTVDNSAGSPFVGRVYNVWTDLGGGANSNDILFSRSTNGGTSWSTVANISNNVNAGSHNQGCNVQTGPNGEVYVTWAIYDSWPSDESAIGFNRSTDGGTTWVGETRALPNIRGIRNTTLPNEGTRANAFPSMAVDVSGGPLNGTIYIVWTNIGVPGVNTGDADVYLIRSTNQGVSWSTPVRVNQDATTNANYHPWMTCDPSTGELSVNFYDRRDNAGNLLTTNYVAHSVDGGLTWEDFRVGDVQFTPAPIPGLAGGYMGDYIGIAANGGIAYPVWSDWRTSPITAYVSPVVYSPPSTDPNIVLSATALAETLLEYDSSQLTFTVRNQGLVANSLEFAIAENPEASWLTVTPTADTLAANEFVTINVDINTSGLEPGVYSTVLDITSNDPSDPLKTVTVDFVLLGAPRMIVTENNFNFTTFAGQTLFGNYTLWNAGKGSLSYNVLPEYLGGPGGNDEQFGSPLQGVAGGLRSRGNVYQVNQSTLLRESQFYLGLTAATNVEFFVYEGTSPTGTFNRIYSSGPSLRGPGTQFYLQAGINVQLVAGRYYYIGASWQQNSTYWYDNSTLPKLTSFGSLLYGTTGSGGGYPASASVSLTSTTILYPQILKTGFGIVTTLTTPTSGILPDSTSAPQQFQSVVDPLAPNGTYNFRITTAGNDPVNTSHQLGIVIDVISSPTGVENPDVLSPSKFALHSNEPNPFNPMTKIAFDLPLERQVTLSVFDVAGRRVKTLVDGVLPAGRHELSWRGQDDSGHDVGSGVYFLRMEAGAFTQNVKMTLVR